MELRERKTTATLKEKLSEHYRNKEFKPTKENINTLGIRFFWAMTISLFFESQIILIPRLYGDNTLHFVLMIVLVWFTLCEAVINWMGMYFGMVNHIDAEVKKKRFPNEQETPKGWTHCFTCQVDSPPRSFHCTHCNVCILKRDHHCFFSSSCIGFYNQRFFILFLIYMIWGNVFALFLQLSYLNEIFPINSSEFVKYLPAVNIVYFLFGQISLLNMFLMYHALFCVMCLGGAVFFLYFQLLIISQGMTSYEAMKIGPIYNKGVACNFRSVFGTLKLIPIQLIFPLFPVYQEHDGGTKWELSQRFKGQ